MARSWIRPDPAALWWDCLMRVLWSSPMTWACGGEYALLAVHALLGQGRSIRLTMSGHGPEAERLLYTRQDLGLQPHVRFDWEPANEPCGAHHAFLWTALADEALPALADALELDLPVVASALDCADAVVAAAESSRRRHRTIRVPTRDPESIAEALESIRPGIAR